MTIDDGSGAPPTTLLAAVSAAIDAVRPVGTQFAVQPPQPVLANVALTIVTPAATHTTAQIAVTAAVTTYISGLSIGVPLSTSRLAAIAFGADPSITNVTGLTINGGGDLLPASTGVIKPGTVTVN